jgi:hypothetical protein
LLPQARIDRGQPPAHQDEREHDDVIGPRIGVSTGVRVGVAAGLSSNEIAPDGGGFIIAGIFDSNGISKGTTAGATRDILLEFGVDADFPSVTVNEKIADTGAATPTDTPGGAFGTLFGPAPLRAHAGAGVAQRFGSEITLGRQLYAIDSRFGYLTTCAITSAELQSHWLPTANFPTTPPNFYTIEKNRLKALEASTGRVVKVIYCDLGANDSVNAGPAGNMQVNMGTMVTQLHADFPSAVIIWPLLHLATGTAFAATVRTQMLAYSATAPAYFFMPNIDYTTTPDATHWDNPTSLTIGQQIADASREMLAIAPVSTVTTPDVVGDGVTQFRSGDGTLTANAWKGTRDEDIELLFAMGGGLVASGMPALTDPAGWTNIINNTTTAGIINARWKVWWRKVPVGEYVTDTVANSHDRSPPQASVTYTNSAENTLKRIAIRGPVPSTLAVDTSISDQFNLNNTGPRTISAVTTSANNSLVVIFTGGPSFTAAPATTAFTAAGLANFTRVTESYFNFTDTTNSLISISKGTKATAGSTGTASATYNVNVMAISAVVAFKPA